MTAHDTEDAIAKVDAAIDAVLASPQLNELQALRIAAIALADLPRERRFDVVPLPVVRYARLGTALHEASHAVIGHSLALTPSDLRLEFHVDASVGFPGWTEWLLLARDENAPRLARWRKAVSLALIAAAGGAGQALIGFESDAYSTNDSERLREALEAVAIPVDEGETVRVCAAILARAFANQIGRLAVDAFRQGNGGIIGTDRLIGACLPFNFEAAESMRDGLVSTLDRGGVGLPNRP